jgi:hypothetical protein
MTPQPIKQRWPYWVDVTAADDQQTRETWLQQNLGEFKDRWYSVYRHNGTKYFFLDHKDAVLFLLRWS